MKTTTTVILFFFSILVFAKEPDSDKILKEGQLLYRLEKASWYGTDYFLEYFPEMRDSIGGYLSYKTDNNRINNIFFSNTDNYRILMRFQFDSLPKKNPLTVDRLNHVASQIEKDLITIRQDAVEKIYTDKDDFFTVYKNTSLNLIPLITSEERKVFIITGPQVNDIVVIGNDYVLKYDAKNKFKKKAKIHNSMLQFPYKSEDPKDTLSSTYHSHVLSDCISSTDICTLLLYRDFVEWKQHYVISKNYVSIFNIEKEVLIILTRKAWDRIGKDQEERQK